MAKSPKRQIPREHRRAEAVTVLWMLCLVATVLAEVSGLGVGLTLQFSTDADRIPRAFRAFPGLMLLAALVTGLLSALLLPLVYRFRRLPPPPSLVAFSLVAAILPLLMGILLTLRR